MQHFRPETTRSGHSRKPNEIFARVYSVQKMSTDRSSTICKTGPNRRKPLLIRSATAAMPRTGSILMANQTQGRDDVQTIVRPHSRPTPTNPYTAALSVPKKTLSGSRVSEFLPDITLSTRPACQLPSPVITLLANRIVVILPIHIAIEESDSLVLI